jgi:hypothetical protein
MTPLAKLKIGKVEDDKPVTLTRKIPAETHRDLIAYAEVLSRERGKPVEPNSLVVAMLKRFMATDRAFTRARRNFQDKDG